MAGITSVSFFHFKKNRFWAFKQMGLAPVQFKDTAGLHFFKFLGTGGGSGFSLWPDFSTYALLGVWETQEHFETHLKQHPIYKAYTKRAFQSRHLLLQPIHSHGKWSGKNPFKTPSKGTRKDSSPLVIITRATLNWRRLLAFWRAVPHASRAISKAKGVRFYKGIGEWPFIQQATLSIWENAAAVHEFAYATQEHAQIVTQTRQQKWYKEDLFVRFELLFDQHFNAEG